MPILNRSCCGCNLQNGSIISGCITLLGGLVYFIGLVLMLVFNKEIEDYMDTLKEQHYLSFDLTGFMSWFTMVILSTILAFVYLIFTCLMLYGCREERRVFLMPWMLMTTLEVFAVLVGIIMALVSLGDFQPVYSAITGIIGFIAVGCYAYMLLIVVSYYQYLKDTQDGYYPPTEMSKH
ncbi:uncharacterized protein LOC119108901 [Pollicipes pollicipes]|uniref:uncharacterized protein LOC119108901 n=1 Tax=Pollicipes pollicipes TaxID=41117 RepID=UPI00188504A5|nr:uncharacterized protein LOC119108901 [Pollicipes pollicipes]